MIVIKYNFFILQFVAPLEIYALGSRLQTPADVRYSSPNFFHGRNGLENLHPICHFQVL
jgi:hypothetical protein